MSLGWHNTESIKQASWTCGYCGHEVAGDIGFKRDVNHEDGKKVYICPYCENPTAFIFDVERPCHLAGSFNPESSSNVLPISASPVHEALVNEIFNKMGLPWTTSNRDA